MLMRKGTWEREGQPAQDIYMYMYMYMHMYMCMYIYIYIYIGERRAAGARP